MGQNYGPEYHFFAAKKIGEIYLKSESPEKAAEIFEDILKDRYRKRSDEVIYMLAKACLLLGRHERALELIEDLVREYPDSGTFGIRAMYMLAEYYESHEVLEDAIKIYQGIVELAPGEEEGLAGDRLRKKGVL